MLGSLTLAAQNKKSDHPAIEEKSLIHFKYAQLLDTTVETIKNMTLYKFIEDWWKTKYHYGGGSKDGIDCSSFSGVLMRSVFGKELPRDSREQYAATQRVERDHLTEGDLVFFHTRRGVSHVGVYLMNGFFVHASTKEGVIISNLKESYYNKRYLNGGRLGL